MRGWWKNGYPHSIPRLTNRNHCQTGHYATMYTTFKHRAIQPACASLQSYIPFTGVRYTLLIASPLDPPLCVNGCPSEDTGVE